MNSPPAALETGRQLLLFHYHGSETRLRQDIASATSGMFAIEVRSSMRAVRECDVAITPVTDRTVNAKIKLCPFKP